MKAGGPHAARERSHLGRAARGACPRLTCTWCLKSSSSRAFCVSQTSRFARCRRRANACFRFCWSSCREGRASGFPGRGGGADCCPHSSPKALSPRGQAVPSRGTGHFSGAGLESPHSWPGLPPARGLLPFSAEAVRVLSCLSPPSFPRSLPRGRAVARILQLPALGPSLSLRGTRAAPSSPQAGL